MVCRVFFPKGQVGKFFSIEDERIGLDKSICEENLKLITQALRDRFVNLPPLGKVYVDPILANYSVPMSQRSASRSKRVMTRGSRISLGEKVNNDTIRFFLWWKEAKGKGRIDVDLSATLHTQDWDLAEYISYTNLKSDRIKAAHSGDITSAPDGACEYIDIDLSSAKNKKCRYIVMNIYSFTRQPFSEMPECYAGWMMREKPQGGEIFEASTVQQRFDLKANATVAIPAIIDVEKREVIWCDLALSRRLGFSNNLEANKRSVANLGYAMTHHCIPQLHTLFTLHSQARGELVKTKEGADTIFSLDTGITPNDLEIISAEYL